MLSISVEVYSEEKKQGFTSEELKVLRSASAVILKSRAKEKSLLTSESDNIRSDVVAVREMLEQDLASFSVPQMELGEYQEDIPEFNAQGELVTERSNKKANKKANKRAKREARKAKKLARLSSAEVKKKLRKRRQLFEEDLRIEKKKKNRKNKEKLASARKERVIKMLASLEEDLGELESAKANERKKKLKRLLEKWERKENNKKADPTISTITEHYRK
ncbi:hypothetical protein R50073_37920 [Maricurvus nonylphenolicus]